MYLFVQSLVIYACIHLAFIIVFTSNFHLLLQTTGAPKPAHQTQRQRVAARHRLARATVCIARRHGPRIQGWGLPPRALGTLAARQQQQAARQRRRLASGTDTLRFLCSEVVLITPTIPTCTCGVRTTAPLFLCCSLV